MKFGGSSFKLLFLPWIILFFAALCVIFLGGKRRAFGSFVAVFHKEYNISLAQLNWIGDSYAAVGYMTSGLSITIILYFNRRYGLFQFIGALWILISCITSSFVPDPTWLFLTHTVFHGIGSSLIISTTALVVNEYFDKNHRYHILATTLVSGGSVASIVFVEFFALLIHYYRWRKAFIILGVIYFLVCGSAAIFFRKNDKIDQIKNNKSVLCRCKGVVPLHVPILVLWLVDRIMTSVVTYGMLLNLTAYIYRHNKDISKSTMLTALFAAGEAATYLIGVIITALTKDFFKEKLRYILLGSSVLMALSLVLLGFFDKVIIARRVLCFLAGFGLGPSITFLFPAGEELTRLPGHVAYPFSLWGMGFGMIISPLLTAEIAERFHYRWFFIVQGFLIFLKVACILIIIVILHFYQNRLEEMKFSEDEVESQPSEVTNILSNDRKSKSLSCQ